MKLPLARAFKIASKIDFGSKRIPQTAPNSPPKSFPKIISSECLAMEFFKVARGFQVRF